MSSRAWPFLIVVSAPSGAGKSTLCAHLLREMPDLALSISSTTRAPRGSEVHGKEYFFLGKEEFERKIAAGAFAEWALVHGNYYGTAKDTIETFFAAGKHVLLDIDVQGAASLRAAYPDRCLTVFVAPPSIEELDRRLHARGTDSEETIRKRMAASRAELARAGEFDVVIVNDRLDRATAELHAAVDAAKAARRPGGATAPKGGS